MTHCPLDSSRTRRRTGVAGASAYGSTATIFDVAHPSRPLAISPSPSPPSPPMRPVTPPSYSFHPYTTSLPCLFFTPLLFPVHKMMSGRGRGGRGSPKGIVRFIDCHLRQVLIEMARAYERDGDIGLHFLQGIENADFSAASSPYIAPSSNLTIWKSL